jgi:UDP-N-acetylbacillosamine N-acetyltransferase
MEKGEFVTKKQKLIIWGASGHALVVADTVRLQREYEIVGFLDDINPDRKNAKFCGSCILGGQEQLIPLLEQKVNHIIFGFGDCKARLELSRIVKELGFSLATAVHPSATIANDVSVGEGTLIVAGSVVSPGVSIGENVIINTHAGIGHGSVIEDGVHIAPGVNLAGDVHIGRGTWVGIGTSIATGIRIGSNSLIGVGAVVVKDIPNGVVAYGVPARIMRKNIHT